MVIKLLLKALTKVENVFLYISSLSLLVMMLIITGDALMRYFFNSPLLIAYDATELYLLPLLVFFTISYALREDEHLRVTFLVRYIPKWLKRFTDTFGFLLVAIVFAVITYKGFQLTYDAWINNRVILGVYRWPVYLAFAIVPIGSFLMVIRSIVLSLQSAIKQ